MAMSALNSSKSSHANCIQVVILKKSNSELSYIIVKLFNSFQSSIAFHIETSHLFCRAKRMTGFYMKLNTCLKWVNNVTGGILFSRFLKSLIYDPCVE